MYYVIREHGSGLYVHNITTYFDLTTSRDNAKRFDRHADAEKFISDAQDRGLNNFLLSPERVDVQDESEG